MTERDSLELLIQIQTRGEQQLAVLTRMAGMLEAADKRATEATAQLGAATQRAGESMSGAVLKAQLMADGIMKVASAVKSYTVDAAQYAARTEQISAVMDNLARVNGMNVGAVRQQANAIKELGISTQESRNVINMMIGSQLDLSKSLEMTRMAQNAAKVAGISSSEALQRMTYAITSGQPEMLRTLGIAVNFENAYANAAKAMGKTSNALTEQEKLQIRQNAVLARSPLIDGSYVISLTTAAGQMQSLTRYTDDLKNSLGQGLQPALFDVVTGMERLTKFAQENIDTFQQMTAGVTALGVAGAVFAATPFLPPVARAGAAAAAGVGTYLFTNQDPVQANVDKYTDAFKRLDGQKKVMEKQLKAGLVDEEAFKRFANQLPAYREILRQRFIEETAEIFKQRAKGGQFPKGMMERWDLADRVHVTREEMETVMNGQELPFDKSGLVAHNPLLKTNTTDTEDKKAAKLLEQRHEQFKNLLRSLDEHGLDPIAKIVADTEAKLQDIAHKYGPLSSTEAAYAMVGMENAITRERGKHKIEPVESEGPEYRGFMYGWQRPQAQMVNVDDAAVDARRNRQLSTMQRALAYQEQMVKLTAGPGGEAAAINEIMHLRMQYAKSAYDLSRKNIDDLAKYEAEVDQAKKDRLIQIAQMQRAQVEEYRQAAGGIYDAMVQKGMTGIGDFMKGQVQVIGRTVFQNLAVEVFKQAKDTLKLGDLIGGQVGKDGKLTAVGRALKGTPFGIDESKLVLQDNTAAQKDNTAALRENTAAQRTGGTGSGAAQAAADSAGALVDNPKVTSRFQRLLGSALSIGAGAYGIAQGVQQGGAKGALNATAGAASMMSGLIGSKLFGAAAAAGPLGGILAGAAAGIGLVASFFGHSKEKFDQQQTDTLNRNKYEAPTASNRVIEINGSDVDYDFTGRLRAANERNTTIIFQISAMDSKSFLDRSNEIAEALHKELGLGHRVAVDIQNVVMGT